MTFADPVRLWLLVLVAALALLYVLAQRRRGSYALRFSDTTMLDSVAPKRPGWRRHVVAATFLGTVTLMVVALAGPSRDDQIPRERATVVLTIDTSLSMGADDVDPTRIAGAQEAALAFVDDAPESVQIGLVTFDAVPVIRVAPTDDRATLRRAIESIELAPATATGDAILAGLDAIEASRSDGETPDDAAPDSDDPDSDDPDADDDAPDSVIVLLSDGTPTEGAPVDLAVAEAVAANVPVSTVAFGTAEGIVTVEDPEVPGSMIDVPVPVDEPTLDDIADRTGGEFYSTASPDELADVYADIGTTIGFDTEQVDVSDWFIAAALAIALLTAALSLRWFQRLP